MPPIANYPGANLRHYAFLQQGLPDIEEDLAARNIAFVLRRTPDESVERMIADVDAAMLVGDENPLRGPERWRQVMAQRVGVPFWTVDADVVVPSKLIEKAQYGAYTIRPRLYRLLPDYLRPYENTMAEHEWKRPAKFKAERLGDDITRGWTELDRSVQPVEAWRGGHHAAVKRLKHFTGKLLTTYERDRNHPELDGTSMLSPYLHFGHIGPVTVALAVDAAAKRRPELKAARDSYFNELIAWRELAVNFVKYSADYDNPNCAENWAKATSPSMRGMSARWFTRWSRWSGRRRTMSCGTRRSGRCCTSGGCTTTCACTGRRRSWSGRRMWRGDAAGDLSERQVFWTGATRTAMRAWRGRWWASSTGLV